MKKFLLASLGIVASLLLTQQAFAAIALVNSSLTANNAAGTNVTSSLSITTGNLIVLSCRHGTTFVSPSNVTDTIGNVFTDFAIASNSASGAIDGYWAISSGTNAADVISCNFASSVGGRSIVALQYSGVASTTPLDATSTNASTTLTSSFSTGPFTTTSTNEVIVGMGSGGGGSQTIAAGSGYTMEASTTFGGSTAIGTEDKIVSSIQTGVSSTIQTVSGSQNWMFIAGTFKAASAVVSTSSDALFFAGD
jgi:hypothetical protein